MAKQLYIVDEMRTVVEKVNTALTAKGFATLPVYYMYGHPKEIHNRLQELTNSPTEAHKKFPLIILFTDIAIKVGEPGYFGGTGLRMLIANITQPEYISEQRTELNYKPIIHPIKDELLNQITRYKQFTFEGELKYTETDMYFYGSQINDKNVFPDRIDATELSNIQININNKC